MENQSKPDWVGGVEVMMLRNYQADEKTRMKKGAIYKVSGALAKELSGKGIASQDAVAKQAAEAKKAD